MGRRHNKDCALLPADFASSGLVVNRIGPPPTRFQVLGERSSGTNLASRLLARNSHMQPSDALGWKHGFPAAIAIPADLAVICMVRNAAGWARSMHAKPWHTAAEMQALEFSEFLRAPWHSTIDRPRYFPASKGMVGQPLQQDRDPQSGCAFANLFALRRAKLTGLISYLNRGCTCVVLRIETLQAEPETIVDAVLSGLDQPARITPFRPVVKRLGSRFKAAIQSRPATPDHLAEKDLAFLRTQTDPDQEALLGYVY